MKETFRPQRFHGKSEEMLTLCDSILTDYAERLGQRLTLRQLYYQLIRRNTFENNKENYRMLANLASNGRLAGRLDWDAIEDRLRIPSRAAEFGSLGECVNDAIGNYRRKRWEDQPYYVELWVEKDALSGVLSPIAHDFHIALAVNRGYTSQSAMYNASKRYLDALERDKTPVLLYVGDHDPSGVDMVRDIRERFEMFGVSVEVRRVALTWEQVKHYKPPPNPVGPRMDNGRVLKADARMASYVAKYGKKSWEVDALDPETLNELTTKAIEELIDRKKYDRWIEEEQKDLEGIKEYLKDPNGVEEQRERACKAERECEEKAFALSDLSTRLNLCERNCAIDRADYAKRTEALKSRLRAALKKARALRK